MFTFRDVKLHGYLPDWGCADLVPHRLQTGTGGRMLNRNASEPFTSQALIWFCVFYAIGFALT